MTSQLPEDLLVAYRSGAPDWASTAVARVRDLVLMRHESIVTVIACDANAGIGDQASDSIAQSARDTGFGAAKVPLMEVMAAGAVPTVLVNTLGMSRSGVAGTEILRGITECLALSGHAPVITGSDETNVVTTQTSVGVTVIGVAAPEQLRLGRAQAGDDVFVVGLPKDGIDVPYAESDADLVTPRDVAALLADPNVHEVLPVGSRGVGYEAGELARTAGLHLELVRTRTIALGRSAGSSTCLIVASTPGSDGPLALALDKTVTRIGTLAGNATGPQSSCAKNSRPGRLGRDEPAGADCPGG